MAKIGAEPLQRDDGHGVDDSPLVQPRFVRPLIAISGSSVNQGQHETFSHQIVAEDTQFQFLRHSFAIGEMVDKPKGLEFVRECEVQYVQGFLFGEPNANILSFGKMDKNVEKLFGKKPTRRAFG